MVLLAYVSASSCVASTTHNLGAAAALRGQSVADAALASHKSLEDQHASDKRQHDFITIVTNFDPNPTTVMNTALPDSTLQLLPPARWCHAWQGACVTFHRARRKAERAATSARAGDPIAAGAQGTWGFS
jgi:hypothetical protein